MLEYHTCRVIIVIVTFVFLRNHAKIQTLYRYTPRVTMPSPEDIFSCIKILDFTDENARIQLFGYFITVPIRKVGTLSERSCVFSSHQIFGNWILFRWKSIRSSHGKGFHLLAILMTLLQLPILRIYIYILIIWMCIYHRNIHAWIKWQTLTKKQMLSFCCNTAEFVYLNTNMFVRVRVNGTRNVLHISFWGNQSFETKWKLYNKRLIFCIQTLRNIHDKYNI